MTLKGTKEENDEYNDIDDKFDDDCRLFLVRRVVLWERSPDPLGIYILSSRSRSVGRGGLQLTMGHLPPLSLLAAWAALSRRHK